MAAEQAAKERLGDLGFKDAKDYRVDPGTMEITPKKLAGVIPALVADGWRVEAEGILYRPASEFKLAVTSSIDWLELGGQVHFGNQGVPLPEVLAAARRGETMIKLDDGSMGMLPEEWLEKYGLLIDLGTPDDQGNLRFDQSQAGLLDALLASQPEIRCDAGFEQVRKQLHGFEGIEALDGSARLPGHLAALPARGPGLAGVPPPVRLRRHPGRRHGPGQDDPGARAAAAPAGAPPVQGAEPDRRAPLAGLQLAPGGRQVHPAAAGARLHRRQPPPPARRSSTTTT